MMGISFLLVALLFMTTRFSDSLYRVGLFGVPGKLGRYIRITLEFIRNSGCCCHFLQSGSSGGRCCRGRPCLSGSIRSGRIFAVVIIITINIIPEALLFPQEGTVVHVFKGSMAAVKLDGISKPRNGRRHGVRG